MHINAIKMGVSFVYLKWSQVRISKLYRTEQNRTEIYYDFSINLSSYYKTLQQFKLSREQARKCLISHNYIALLSLKNVSSLSKSVDHDEMPQSAAFHLRPHCLPKYMFRGFQNTKG